MSAQTETPSPVGRALAWARTLLRPEPVMPSTAVERWGMTLLPIVPIVAWWLISLGFYVVRYPVPYTHVNVGLVVALVLVTVALAVAGFASVSRLVPRTVVPVERRRAPIVVMAGAVLGLLVLVPWAETYSGYHLWQIVDALRNQGDAYVFAAGRVLEGSGSRLPFIVVQTLVAPLSMVVVPFAALAFFERRAHLGWLVAGVIPPLSMSVLVGRDFYFVLTGLLVVAAWLVSRARRDVRFTWRFFAVGGAAVVLALVLWGVRKMSRADALQIQQCIPGADECTYPDISTLWNTILVNLGTYASQSLEGLGRALEGDWAFGGGYRHSPALTGIVEAVFGPSRTVVITDQLESAGWSDTAFWSTGLARYANDVPWVLVPVLIGLMAAFLALAWRRSVRGGDWLSIGVFAYSWFTMWLLIQNLQLATSGPLYVGYLFLCALFLAREVRDLVRRPRPTAPDRAD